MSRNEAHPITVEVVRNAIVAYADEMANALMKSAYNMMIYEVRDYCCGLIDTQARMISQNRGGLPIFLADLGVAVADGIARYGLDGFEPGDVVVMNQGEVCGQHLNNVVVYSPCFHGDELVGFAANRAHWVDIGGMHQGFGSTGTTDIYAEGLQMRSLKIYEAGERNETLWQIIRDNVRYPDASLGDLRAQIASCQLGARRYAELIARYGRDTVEACIAKVWDQAELAARRVVESIPDGRYEAESFLDNDGRNLTTPLRVKVDGAGAGLATHGRFHRDESAGAEPAEFRPLRRHRCRARRLQGADLARSRRQRRLLPAARRDPARRHHAERQATGGARPLEHRAADGDRHDPQGAVAGGAAPHPGRAQGRHGRLLVLRISGRTAAGSC